MNRQMAQTTLLVARQRLILMVRTVGFYADNIYKNGSTVQSGVFGSYAASDILMVAYDADNGYVYFGRNGTWNNGAPGRV